MKYVIFLIILGFASMIQAEEVLSCKIESYRSATLQYVHSDVNFRSKVLSYAFTTENSDIENLQKCEKVKSEIVIPLNEISVWGGACLELEAGKVAYVQIQQIGLKLTKNGSKLLSGKPDHILLQPVGKFSALVENNFARIINPDAGNEQCF